MAATNFPDLLFGSFKIPEDDAIVLEFEVIDSWAEDDLLNALEEAEASAMDFEQPPEQEPVNTVETKSETKTTKSRFATANEDEVDDLVGHIHSKGTAKQTKWGVKQLKTWLSERGLPTDFENDTETEIDKMLSRFYAELRNVEGEYYQKASFVGLRASINRHLRSPPYNRVLNLMSDKEFTHSNKVFTRMVVKLKKEGLDKTTHHGSITETDLQKLRESDVMETETPKGLQRKVWFDLSLGFARRGQENVQNLKKNSYEVKQDSTGMKYIEMTFNESTKNHKGTNLRDDDTQKPRLYETQEKKCPIQSFEKYISKLNPECDRLFQQVKPNVKENDDTWYNKRPLGEKSIAKFMKEMSAEAALSRIYTNHCVRATTITKLAHAGIEKTEIMKITGHKNIKSIESYSSDSSETQKRQYSSILQEQSRPNGANERSISSTSSSTVASTEENQQNPIPQNQNYLNYFTPPTQNIENNILINNSQQQIQRAMPNYYFAHSCVNIHNHYH